MKSFLLFLVLFTGILAQAQNTLTGKWKTIDDETGQPKSIIEIFEKDGKFYGKIEKLFRKADEDQNPKCDKCSGDKKDQLVIGMQILNDLKKNSETEWSGGDILDPNNGKTYSCKVELIENGKKLKVRGFIGFSLLGRTQFWLREESGIAPATVPAPNVPGKTDIPPKNN